MGQNVKLGLATEHKVAKQMTSRPLFVKQMQVLISGSTLPFQASCLFSVIRETIIQLSPKEETLHPPRAIT